MTFRMPLSAALLLVALSTAHADDIAVDPYRAIDQAAAAIEDQVIAWRRDIHQHPELGNREFRTAGIVADHLRSLGIEVRTEVAHSGVVGVLKGTKPGKVVALRADMDALPVTEQTGLPFASKETTVYNGKETGVMHACGHDAHVAVLMGVAEILAGMRENLQGTVKFIFQPAEEGPPEDEDGGARMMVAEGALDDPRPEAIFGLHVGPRDYKTIGYASGPLLSSSDRMRIRVVGRQTHGASPWRGIDPVVVAAQIIMGLQTIHSRQIDVREPHVISVGMVQGGVRFNIIPDEVDLIGTVRTQSEDVRADVHERIVRTAQKIAESAGATAEVSFSQPIPVTVNDPALTEKMLPTLERVAGAGNVQATAAVMGYEDFSYFAQEVPGLFFFLGTRAPDMPQSEAAPNHSPLFVVEESALILGVRALANLTVDFLAGPPVTERAAAN